ncbi:MAG: hypothetical protein OEV31_08310 [Gammaproteobacteria bacterium]|nr:hypothetical protein [Gammaproteobacteria bacterium]
MRYALPVFFILASLPAWSEDKPAPAADAPAPAAAPIAKGPVLGATRPIRITGQVIDVREDAIVVQKGKEKWEIARHPAAAIKGDLKKGARVTVDFRAIAAGIEVRDEKK